MKANRPRLKAEYRRLQRRLGKTGWISHGYVRDPGSGAGGPCYPWTRKERPKTVSVALPKEQDERMKEAIDHWRDVQLTLKRMEQISRTLIRVGRGVPAEPRPPEKPFLDAALPTKPRQPFPPLHPDGIQLDVGCRR